jgi:hypothetical protein
MVPAYCAVVLVTVGINLFLAPRNRLFWDMMLRQRELDLDILGKNLPGPINP